AHPSPAPVGTFPMRAPAAPRLPAPPATRAGATAAAYARILAGQRVDAGNGGASWQQCGGLQGGGLGETEHQIEVLYRLPRRALHQVVDDGQDHSGAAP